MIWNVTKCKHTKMHFRWLRRFFSPPLLLSLFGVPAAVMLQYATECSWHCVPSKAIILTASRAVNWCAASLDAWIVVLWISLNFHSVHWTEDKAESSCETFSSVRLQVCDWQATHSCRQRFAIARRAEPIPKSARTEGAGAWSSGWHS